MAGHAHALVDARRCRGRADRTGLLDVVGTVRDGAATEMVALMLAGKPLALRRAGDVHPLAGREQIRLQCLADLVAGVGLEPDLAHVAMGGDPGLLEMSGRGLGELFVFDLAETELDRTVAIFL